MKKLLPVLALAAFSRIACAADSVIDPGRLPAVEVMPGMSLRELIGRAAPARSQRYSVAHFTVAKGASTGTSYNKVAEESFLILSGQGHVVLGRKRLAVRPGSVVIVPAEVRHSLHADAGQPVAFYAICAPAFEPGDYVVVPAKK